MTQLRSAVLESCSSESQQPHSSRTACPAFTATVLRTPQPGTPQPPRCSPPLGKACIAVDWGRSSGRSWLGSGPGFGFGLGLGCGFGLGFG